MEFLKEQKPTKILNPLKNFEEDTLIFEYRTDPLTGRNTTVIKDMLKYIDRFLSSDSELLNSLIEKTKSTCPFCPENIGTKTPLFPKEFLVEGRIFFGDSILIPNLLGHAQYSALAILSRNHHLKLDEFSPELLLNAFKGSVKYLRRLNQTDPAARFPVFVFNYLTPAGSSIFHPHMQILVRDRPFYLVDLLLQKSKAYFENHGSSYWRDLILKERNGERYLFGGKGVEWIVPFAPLRGLNEIQAIVEGKASLNEIDDDEWSSLAEGLAGILGFYDAQGYTSFNIIVASGPMDTHLNYFDVNLRIISRPGVQPFCFTDAWAVPYMLWDGEAVEEPERFAERLKTFFKRERS